MAEIRINTTGGLKLYDADNSHYAQIVAGTITANVDLLTLNSAGVTVADGAIDFDIASHDTSNGLKLGGTLVTATAAELNIMDGVTATAAEINLIDGGTARGTTAIADGDGVLINDAGTMRQTTVETLKTYIGGFDVTSITGATALAVEPALTDEMVLSDAGTLKRLDMQHVLNVPAFHAYMSVNQNFSSGTGATVQYDVERFDIGSCYNTSNYKFTPGVAGWYWIYGVNYFASGIDDGEQHASFVRKNGTDIYRYGYSEIQSARTDMTSMGTFNIIVYADADDYFECRVWQNSGSTLALNRDYGSWGGFRITGVDSSAPSSGPPEN